MARRHTISVLLRLTSLEARVLDLVATQNQITRTEVLRILVRYAPQIVTTPPRIGPLPEVRKTAENAATGPK